MTDRGGFDPPTGPPAGWYPDPYDPSRERYWDGTEWDLSADGATAPTSADYPNLGNWLDRSFRGAYGRWRAVLLVALVTASISTPLALLALERLVDGLIVIDDEIQGWTNDRIPAVIGLGLAALAISAIGTLAITSLMLDRVDRGDAASSQGGEIVAAVRALGRAIVVLPRAVGWFVVLFLGFFLVAAVVVVVLAAFPPGGAVLVLGTATFGIWLAIKWVFIVVAIVDQPGNPFPRSSSVSDQRWWSTFGRLLLLFVIMWLISLIIQTIASVIAGDAVAGFGADVQIGSDGSIERAVLDDGIDITATTMVVTVLTSIAGTVLVSSVSAGAIAILYRTRNPRR